MTDDQADIQVTHLSTINNSCCPYEWLGNTATGQPFYLRFRTGLIEAKVGGDYGIDGTQIYDAGIDQHHTDQQTVFTHIREESPITLPIDVPELPPEDMNAYLDAFKQKHAVGSDGAD